MFKSITEFEGLYEVNELGDVRSLNRIIINKNGKPQRYPGKVLKPFQTDLGYRNVALSKDHKRYDRGVHRLVALMFIPNLLNKPFINHIDNNPSNNNVNNLEWCTHSENMLHAQRQGRLFAAQSKGGKTGGIQRVRTVDEYNSMIGKIFSCWLVKSLADHRGEKQYFNVECTICKTEYTREKSYLKHYKQNNCIKCKTR